MFSDCQCSDNNKKKIQSDNYNYRIEAIINDDGKIRKIPGQFESVILCIYIQTSSMNENSHWNFNRTIPNGNNDFICLVDG